MSGVRIAAIGAYTPRLRITAESFADAWGQFDAAGIERKAVPEADEDALTMGVEAAKRALSAAGIDGSDIKHLSFATTTPPMAEEDLTARLASLLGTPATVQTQTLTGSTRAGAQALATALDAGPWGDRAGLIVISDCPRGEPASSEEHAAAAGAAAVVLHRSGAGVIADRGTHIEPSPGTRFRAAGSNETTGLNITQYDRQAFRSALAGAADELDSEPGDVAAAAVQSPDGKLPYRVADVLGVDTDTIATAETVSTLGDTGTASVFLGAATAFEGGADRVLLAAYGSGAGATVAVIDGPVPVESALAGQEELGYPEYLRRRGTITSEEPEGGGAYVSVPSWQRTIPQRHRLIAGSCPNCGALTFPPDGACTDCNSTPAEYETVRLPGTGTVEAATTIAQGGAPPEFVEQQSQSGSFVSAIVALDGPDSEQSVSVPTQVLAGDTAVSVGTEVEMTIRRIYTQEGVIRYGFKARTHSIRR